MAVPAAALRGLQRCNARRPALLQLPNLLTGKSSSRLLSRGGAAPKTEATTLPLSTDPRKTDLYLGAIDLDGTLLRNDGSISERSKEALRAFVADGVANVVLATGNPPAAALNHIAKLGPCNRMDYCIVSNGSTVIQPSTGAIVYQDWLDADVMLRLIPKIRELDAELRLCLEAEKVWFVNSMDWFAQLDRRQPGLGKRLQHLGQERPRLEELLCGGGGEISKAMRLYIIHPDSSSGACDRQIQRLTPLLEADAREHGSRLTLKPAGGGEGALELSPTGVNKAKALGWVCAQLGVQLENVVAFGDNVNDVEMLQQAGWGVAVGNAVPEAIACANEVAPSNEQDGVAAVLGQIAASRF